MALAATGCTTDSGRTALAITKATATATGVTVQTECADHITVEVGPDHGGSALPEVTVWGDPTIGRCHPEVTANVAGRPGSIVDGATSMVVTVDDR